MCRLDAGSVSQNTRWAFRIPATNPADDESCHQHSASWNAGGSSSLIAYSMADSGSSARSSERTQRKAIDIDHDPWAVDLDQFRLDIAALQLPTSDQMVGIVHQSVARPIGQRAPDNQGAGIFADGFQHLCEIAQRCYR